jgi:hypothetical protein
VFVPLIGFLALFTLATVLDAARGEVSGVISLVLFAGVLGGCAVVASGPVTSLLTACAFMDYEGFVVGQQGQLSWHGTADILRLAALVGAAVTGWFVHHGRCSENGSE